MVRASILLGLAIAATQSASAAGTDTYDQSRAIDKVQNARAAAEKLAGDGKESGIRKAIALEQQQVAFLKRPDIRELAVGNTMLLGRSMDLHFDLASLYAKLNDADHALAELEMIEEQIDMPAFAKQVREAPEFAFLKENPRFQAFLKRNERAAQLWLPSATVTQYRPQLPLEERIAGLSDFWARARSGFAHFDNVPDLDWNQAYLEYLARVEKSESTTDYYDTLIQFAALLHDGHTNIYPPKELASHFFARPPVRAELVDGKVVVIRVMHKSLSSSIRTGDEIVEIDGKEVHAYANEHVLPYASASSNQDRNVRLYTYLLLAGDAKQSAILKLRDADGKLRDVTVARDGYAQEDYIVPEQFESKRLAHNIFYLSLGEFEDDRGVKEFEKLLPEIMKSDGLILDVRNNGGGNSDFGLAILSYLTDKALPVESPRYRADDGLRQVRLGGEGAFYWKPEGLETSETIPRKTHYKGKVAVLVSPRTYSAAEDFLVTFDSLKRGIMVGQASGGSTGQPLMFPLPGGGMARICSKDDRYPDGKKFVGIGIMPQVEAHNTVADIRAGHDAVLETAVQHLVE